MEPNRDANDFDEAGQSLAHLAEVVLACLDAIEARSLAEIGANRGELTRELLDWAVRSGARVTAVEPAPRPELVELAERRPELELIRETSHEALPHIELPDAVIVDGDHNHYTVSEELRLIDEGASWTVGLLVIFHDVCWPHGRRDTYYAPERIPERHRQPLVHYAALAPDEPGVAHAGLRYEWAAQREGGPRNGVLTAIEDFAAGRNGLRLAIVPAFFGLGVMWHRDAPWADAVAAVVEPWDRNAVLGRLEAHRVTNLVARYRHAQELGEIELMRRERERQAQQERLLRTMLGSRAFAWGERLSRLRRGRRPAFTREQVRRALGGEDGR
jgi:Methyltransferase domain